MNMIKTMQPGLKAGLSATLALTCLSFAPHARAENILMAQTTLVTGSASTVDSFTVKDAGKVNVSLQGIDWRVASLSALSFSATSADQVLASWSGTGLTGGTLSFDVGPGTYFAHIMATASGALDLGLYSMVMTFTPSAVPLPASGWMLLTGMFVIAGLVRTVRPSLRPFELMGTAGV